MIRCCDVDVIAFGHPPDCPVYGTLRRAVVPQEALSVAVNRITQAEAAERASVSLRAGKDRTWADRRARSNAARKEPR